MELRFAPTFLASAQWFEDYYSAIFPDGKMNATAALADAFNRLESDRTLERKFLPIDGIFELVIQKTPFSILYAYQSDWIEVLFLNDRRGHRAEAVLLKLMG